MYSAFCCGRCDGRIAFFDTLHQGLDAALSLGRSQPHLVEQAAPRMVLLRFT